MKILIAPDKFKDKLSADRVAAAMMRGARKVHSDASFTIRPIADGGEGTIDALLRASGGRVQTHTVLGPLSEPVDAEIAVLDGQEVVIEMASASGLGLVERSPDSAARAHTFGTGQLIAAAAEAGPRRVVIGIGGSASTDGGTGAARACGWRFLDGDGLEIPLGGEALNRVAHIEPPPAAWRGEIVGACDVDNPLTGERGAAPVFSGQKGADAETVARLEEGLWRLAQVIRSDVGVDVATVPLGGAGGGTGAGLIAFFGATLWPGFELIAEAIALRGAIEESDLVVTGEGRLDSSSLGGKAPIAIGRMAQRLHTPCIAIVGDLQVERSVLRRNGIETAVGLLQSGGGALADSDPESAIREKALEGLLTHRQEQKKGRSIRR